MFAAFLAISLTAAPIPKSQYEGRIAVLLRDPKPELILFIPNGEIEKRIPLHDLGVDVYSLRLGRDGKTALLTTQSHVPARLANQDFAGNNGYLIDLTGIEKPKKFFTGKSNLVWILNRDCTKAYGTYIDEVKSAKASPSDILPYEHWCLDLKTGVSKPIDLPDTHCIVDISADDQTVLTSEHAKNRYYAATAVVGNWKPTRISDRLLIPYGFAPDGKNILAWDSGNAAEKKDAKHHEHGHYVIELATMSKRAIRKPEGSLKLYCLSYNPDGKRLCFIAQYPHPMNPKVVTYKLFTCSVDGSNQKMIYEGKDEELLSHCDWS